MMTQLLESLSEPQTVFTLLLWLFLLYIGLVIGRKVWKFRKMAKKVNALPGPALSWNPLGHTTLLRTNIKIGQMEGMLEAFSCLAKMYERQYSLCRIWILNNPIVLVYKADVVEKVLRSPTNINKSSEYYFFKPWLKDCLLLSKGAKWLHRRKIIQPAFHLHILEQFLPVMNEHTSVLLNKIYQGVSTSKDVFDVKKLILPLTFDIICETAMGVKLNSHEEGSKFIETLLDMVQSIIVRMTKPWFWNDVLYYLFSTGREDARRLKKVEDFVLNVIQARKAEFLQNNSSSGAKKPEMPGSRKRRLAFLDLLLEQHFNDPQQWTDADLEEEVQIFFAAGHETVSVNIIWTLLMVANDGRIQGKLQQEIDDAWAHFELSNHPDRLGLSSEHLQAMPYLEAVIKESLRLVPPSMTMGRYAREDVHLDDGLVIPRGSTVIMLIQRIHHDPAFFPQPERFIPERWTDPEAPHLANSFAYVPFSGGSRNCVGKNFALKEAKISIASILRHFSLEALQTVDKFTLDFRIVSIPKEPVYIRFVPRL